LVIRQVLRKELVASRMPIYIRGVGRQPVSAAVAVRRITKAGGPWGRYIPFSISGPPLLIKRHTRTAARARKTMLSTVV
jgi:hypothetical protein